MVLDSFFNWLFSPILWLSEPWDIIVISIIMTFIIQLAYKLLTNQEEMKALKEKSKEFQGKLKELKDKPDEMMEIQKKAMESNLKYMKHSMRPMIYTFLPIILVFGWLKDLYPTGVKIINFPFSLPLIGNGLGWLGTYIVVSIIFSSIIRKLMRIY